MDNRAEYMKIYGDESGHLRSLLNGQCDIFVLATVAGDEYDCGSCPKRAVRRITDLEEAKWNDMSENQKRRTIDCFSETDQELRFAYITLTLEDIQDLSNSYLIHQERAFDIDWDLAVIGHAYAQLLADFSGAINPDFIFDRLFKQKQSDQIATVIEQNCTGVGVSHQSSHQVRGIQAADCIAGAISETCQFKHDWLGHLDAEISCYDKQLKEALNRQLHIGEETVP